MIQKALLQRFAQGLYLWAFALLLVHLSFAVAVVEVMTSSSGSLAGYAGALALCVAFTAFYKGTVAWLLGASLPRGYFVRSIRLQPFDGIPFLEFARYEGGSASEPQQWFAGFLWCVLVEIRRT